MTRPKSDVSIRNADILSMQARCPHYIHTFYIHTLNRIAMGQKLAERVFEKSDLLDTLFKHPLKQTLVQPVNPDITHMQSGFPTASSSSY